MPVSSKFYGKAFLSAFNKEIHFDADTIKCSLHTVTYTPNQDTHQYQSDLTNEVAATGGYATGGTTLAGGTMTYTAATNVLMLDGNDVSWPSSTITARYAVLYDSTPGTATANPLICYTDFGADVASTGGTFLITWGTAGIATVTVA